MSISLLDLRPLTILSLREKMEMPVSIATGHDGDHWVVSRYGDVEWDFYPYIDVPGMHASMKKIDWRIRLPGNQLLTDPVNAKLLESAKDFIWSLFADPVEGRKRATHQSLIRKVTDVTTLLRWMVKAKIQSFSALAGRTKDFIPVARLTANGQPAAGETVAHRLLVVEDLCSQRGKISDALCCHPWPHETTTSLSGRSMSMKPRTEFIPDAIAGRLGKVAIEYIQKDSNRIIAAFAAAEQIAQEKIAAGRKTTAISSARASAARVAGFSGWNNLVREMTNLRTACYIIICMFSGIRDSEAKSLEEHCLSPGKSKDGTVNVLWLHGTIYKTGKRTKRWMVPPIVGEAVRLLTRLTAPLRIELQQEITALTARIENIKGKERTQLGKRLDYVIGYQNHLFLARPRKQLDRGITVLTGELVGLDLKAFCADHHIAGDDGKPYPLHSHQFRRTYARFMARSELGDLLTLRDHFGHWSIDMTTYYADGGADGYEADTELLEMVTTEKMDRQGEIMGNYLDSDAPLANGGHWLKDWRASVRTAANKEELIKEYADTITLSGTGHSWCVGNARGTGCGGLCIFEAQMCVDCNYGIIGEEHRAVWQGILEQQKEALALNDIGPGGRARAQNIHNYAEKVLRRLDGQEAS